MHSPADVPSHHWPVQHVASSALPGSGTGAGPADAADPAVSMNVNSTNSPSTTASGSTDTPSTTSTTTSGSTDTTTSGSTDTTTSASTSETPITSSVVSREFRYGSTRIQLDYRFDPAGRLLTVTFSPVSEGASSPDAIHRLLIDVQRTVADTPIASDTGLIRVQTSAMSPPLAEPLFALGFRLRSELTLLTKELPRSPFPALRVRSVRRAHARHDPPVGIEIRRGTEADLGPAVGVDRNAFGDLWAMDQHDLGAALTATPSAQLLIAERTNTTAERVNTTVERVNTTTEHATSTTEQANTMVGFAIVGRSGRRGYLQRLAVSPTVQGHGVGTALVDATCEWSARRDVRRLIVNTQTSNANALRLYHRTGFVESPLGLVLLECDLPPESRR